MYGFSDKQAAQNKIEALQLSQPNCRFVIMAHSWSPSGAPLTWGVGRYVPYCPAMPERFDGFVWF